MAMHGGWRSPVRPAMSALFMPFQDYLWSQPTRVGETSVPMIRAERNIKDLDARKRSAAMSV